MLVTSGAAHADAPPVAPHHLAYSTSGADPSCPDDAAFRRLVALRLGVDPFVAPGLAADRRLVVTVDVSAPRTVTVTLVDRAGKELGRRVLREPPSACEELVANAAFAASVAIDPTVLTRAAAPSAEPAAPAPAPPPEAPAPASPPPPPPPAAPATALVPSLRAGAGASFGVMPAAAPSLTLGASLARERLSAGIEGRFDLPTESDREGVTLRTSLVAGDLHACGRLRPRALSPYLCVALWAGALRGSASGIFAPKDDVSPYVAVGPRAGLALPVVDDVAIDVRADVPFALTSVELRVDDRARWKSPAAGVVVNAGVTLSLP